jgi:23S rRNA (uridine2552-2'-O)-methyltransferase
MITKKNTALAKNQSLSLPSSPGAPYQHTPRIALPQVSAVGWQGAFSQGIRPVPELKLKNRHRTTSSRRWLERQLNDPWVHEARLRGYRSRAAFKLIQIHEKFRLFKPASRIIDLGCAPGSWLQVCRVLSPQGQVTGVDLLDTEPVDGALVLKGNFCAEAVQESARQSLKGGRADIVLSDMAPPTTGESRTDHLRIMHIAEIALGFAIDVMAPGGCLVIKTRQGGSSPALTGQLQTAFRKVAHYKPPSSRRESAEMFVIAQEFRKL